MTSSGESVHFHRPRPARGGIYHTRYVCVYIGCIRCRGGGGKALVASTNRSCTPKAVGAPIGASQQTLTRAPLISISPLKTPCARPGAPCPLASTAAPDLSPPCGPPGAYAVVLLLSCCRLRLLARHGWNMKCCCWVWGLGFFFPPLTQNGFE